MIRVYVAGPIGADDDGRRARCDFAIGIGARLIALGFAPFVPHLWCLACNADGIASYEGWMAYDFAWLDECQALLRIPGESPGADREVARAKAQGIPVFYAVDELELWRDTGAANLDGARWAGAQAKRIEADVPSLFVPWNVEVKP